MDLCANGHTEIVYADVSKRGRSSACPVCELFEEIDVMEAKIMTLEKQICSMEEEET